jgi:maltose-binding protein MalE
MLLMLTSLAGCGGDRDIDKDIPLVREGKLKIWWPGGSDAEKAAIETAKTKYEALYGDVTIEIIPKASSQFYMDYMIATNGSDYPDIAYVDHVYVQQLAFEGIIANLSARDEEIDTTVRELVLDSLWGVSKYEGDTYALPVSANTMATVYNKVILKKVYTEILHRDWTEADVPSTYAELLQACEYIKQYNTVKGLTGDNKLIPYTVPAGSGSNNNSMAAMSFLSYVAREGGSIISSDLKTMTLDTPEVLAAANKLYNLGEAGAQYSSTVFEEGRFEGGRVAFIEMGPWKMQTYTLLNEQDDACDFGWAPIVKFGAGGLNTSPLGLFSMVATNKSAQRTLAIDFMKFFLSDDELVLQHNTPQNLIATTKSAIAADFYKQGVWPQYIGQLNNVVARPGSPEWATMETKFGEFVTALLSGSREPSYVNTINAVLQNALDELYGDGF